MARTRSTEDQARREAVAALSAAGRRMSTAMVLFHTRLAGHVGLGPTDEKVLELVGRFGRPSARDLAVHTGLAANSITNVLDRLVARGFVRRERDPDDGRRVLVVATEEGAQRIGGYFVDLMTGLAELNEDYSTQELQLIADYQTRAADVQEGAARRLGVDGSPRSEDLPAR